MAKILRTTPINIRVLGIIAYIYGKAITGGLNVAEKRKGLIVGGAAQTRPASLGSELAIRAISSFYSEIGLLGLWGSRPDRSFSGIPLLGLSAEVFFGAPETKTLVGICRGPSDRIFSSALRERWSFIGLTDCHGVSL